MILVTGANGFIGRQVVRALRDKEVPLRLVMRQEPIESIDADDAIEVVQTEDVFNVEPRWWHEALVGIDTVIHLAWYAEPGEYLTSSINIQCLQGTISMAQACIDLGVRRFVGIGTCAEYDLTQGMLRVDSPLAPQNIYAACKASTFQVLNQMLPPAGTEFVWCRPFYLYGEGEDSRRLVPHLRQKLSKGQPADLTSGNQIRDFLDVRDAGRMITDAALGKQQGPVNICSGVPITVRQLAEKIADEYDRRDLLRFGVRADNHFDPPCVVGIR